MKVLRIQNKFLTLRWNIQQSPHRKSMFPKHACESIRELVHFTSQWSTQLKQTHPIRSNPRITLIMIMSTTTHILATSVVGIYNKWAEKKIGQTVGLLLVPFFHYQKTVVKVTNKYINIFDSFNVVIQSGQVTRMTLYSYTFK